MESTDKIRTAIAEVVESATKRFADATEDMRRTAGSIRTELEETRAEIKKGVLRTAEGGQGIDHGHPPRRQRADQRAEGTVGDRRQVRPQHRRVRAARRRARQPRPPRRAAEPPRRPARAAAAGAAAKRPAPQPRAAAGTARGTLTAERPAEQPAAARGRPAHAAGRLGARPALPAPRARRTQHRPQRLPRPAARRRQPSVRRCRWWNR